MIGRMELLVPSGTALSDDDLAAHYAFGDGPWLRANFVETLDGAGTGHDHRTDTINTPPDNRVFALNRRLCDAVLVGAGTVRAEGYRRIEKVDRRAAALVIVSNSGRLPETIDRGSEDSGLAVLVTRAAADAEHLAHARDVLGDESVWLVGEDSVDLGAAIARMRAAGWDHILAEGGPTLFADLLADDLVDDVALTFVPTIVGADLTRITHGGDLEVTLERRHLIDADGTLLGLWRVVRDAGNDHSG